MKERNSYTLQATEMQVTPDKTTYAFKSEQSEILDINYLAIFLCKKMGADTVLVATPKEEDFILWIMEWDHNDNSKLIPRVDNLIRGVTFNIEENLDS